MRYLFTTFLVACCFGNLHLLAAEEGASQHKIKIILIGDSTMTDSAGWGLGFKQFLDPNKVELINASRGGRSSMSFIKEGLWTNALALKGDYYLIQFGHNNEPGKPGRSTDMPTFVSDMKRYVDETIAIGAKPVLVTPMSRRQWAKDSTNKIDSSLAPYAVEVRQIAAEKNIPLVELHDRARELCESLGKQKCWELFSPTKVVDGKNVYDNTHLRGPGHVMFARLVVDELRKNVPALAPVLLAEPLNPDPEASDSKFSAVVSADGSGTHTNIQSAIAAAPDDGTNTFSILIKSGTYQGPVLVPKTKKHIHFVGEKSDETILTYPFNVRDAPPGNNLFAKSGPHHRRRRFQSGKSDHPEYFRRSRASPGVASGWRSGDFQKLPHHRLAGHVDD